MAAAAPIAIFIKDPDAVLDYSLDWSEWLKGDIITSSSITPPAGINKDSGTFGASLQTVWVSGGMDGTDYDIVYHVGTAGGRADDRTIRISVRTR